MTREILENFLRGRNKKGHFWIPLTAMHFWIPRTAMHFTLGQRQRDVARRGIMQAAPRTGTTTENVPSTHPNCSCRPQTPCTHAATDCDPHTSDHRDATACLLAERHARDSQRYRSAAHPGHALWPAPASNSTGRSKIRTFASSVPASILSADVLPDSFLATRASLE